MSQFHVFDTFAKTPSGRILHFDVVITENDAVKALNCAKDWMRSLGEHQAQIAAENCVWCHSEDGIPPEMQQAIAEKGYAIFKLEGCPK